MVVDEKWVGEPAILTDDAQSKGIFFPSYLPYLELLGPWVSECVCGIEGDTITRKCLI